MLISPTSTAALYYMLSVACHCQFFRAHDAMRIRIRKRCHADTNTKTMPYGYEYEMMPYGYGYENELSQAHSYMERTKIEYS
eukprot:358152-Chlamydomonas_euryale.AAC.6